MGLQLLGAEEQVDCRAGPREYQSEEEARSVQRPRGSGGRGGVRLIMILLGARIL